MTLQSVLAGASDANLYIIPNESSAEVWLAIGYPFLRDGGKWEFRLFRLGVERAATTGSWDDDARQGWGIESASVVGNAVRFAGDDIGLELLLDPTAPDYTASIMLEAYPDPLEGNASSILAPLFVAGGLTWEPLPRS